jgi:hypothetical protein
VISTTGAFHIEFGSRTKFDIGKHLERRRELEICDIITIAFWLNSRISSNAQLISINHITKTFIDLILQDLGSNLRSIRRGNHFDRYFPRAKASHFHGSRQTLNAIVSLRLDRSNGNRQRKTTFQLTDLLNCGGHNSVPMR